MPEMPEVIAKALDFEENGAKFYTDKASKAQNLLVKRVFESLAKEEYQHQERIQEIYEAMKDGKPWPATDNIGVVLEDTIKTLFSGLSDEQRTLADNVEALEMAIEMERKGYALYQEAWTKSKEEAERDFFQAMQHEEGLHLEALQNVYYYLTDTEDWFANEESKIWNWMNS